MSFVGCVRFARLCRSTLVNRKRSSFVTSFFFTQKAFIFSSSASTSSSSSSGFLGRALSQMTSTAVAEKSNAVVMRLDDVIKSPLDKRAYRALQLRNGLQLLLISDPETDKSAASMDVHVGHLSDPWELPGLAHFCEHMLFLGTKKYPTENDYFKYLQNHGGSANAYTASEHTNYFFDVAPDHLEGALDRFAQFFLGPLFTESATDREVNAVDSENANYLQNDIWRLNQMEHSLSDPNHDYYKFGTGSRKTLMDDAKLKGLNPREELLKFHANKYSANIMSLAILGKESLDVLEEMAVSRLSEVENKAYERSKWEQHPYGEAQLGHRLNIAPVKELRSLHMTFPTPDMLPHYRSHPAGYISHLLGHEGPGSVLSELKRCGWANSLIAGGREGATGFAFFCVDVDLTEAGLDHVEEIVELVFQYLALLRNTGHQEWIHRECQKLSQMKFRFKDKEPPMNFVNKLSTHLHEYPAKEVLVGPYIMDEFRPDLIQMVLDCLTPDRINYAVVDTKYRGLKDNLREKWYGTEYSMRRVDGDLLSRWRAAREHPQLHLPPPNEFIPNKFDLKAMDELGRAEVGLKTGPRLLRNDAFTRIWFKQDDEYLLPKCCMYLHLSNPLTYESPHNQNLAMMYATVLVDEMTEFAYDAELAGVSYVLENSQRGMLLRIGGYDQKQNVLVRRLLEKMVAMEADPGRFEVLKERYVRGLKSFKQEQPYQHAMYYSGMLLTFKAWAKDSLLEATDYLTQEELKAFVPRYLESVHIEALIHGNVTNEEAVELVDNVHGILKKDKGLRPVYSGQIMQNREVKIEDGKSWVYEAVNETHSNSAVELILQSGVQGCRENMLLELLAQVLQEPAFDTLRTNESLGYIVFTGTRRSHGTQGLRFIVQGDKHPVHVESRIEAFLVRMREEISGMSKEEFSENKEALAAKRLERPKKLSQLSGRFWSEIITQQYHFCRPEVEVEDLRKIEKKDLLEYMDRVVGLGAPQRKKLAIRVFSTAAKEQTATPDGAGDCPSLPQSEKIDDVYKFKSESYLFPHPHPHQTNPPPGKTDF